MKINSINYSSIAYNSAFKARKIEHRPQNTSQHSPIHDSVTTASEWFAFGIVFDYVARKCVFSKSPLKNSLALNGILGIGAGIVSGIVSAYKQHN